MGDGIEDDADEEVLLATWANGQTDRIRQLRRLGSSPLRECVHTRAWRVPGGLPAHVNMWGGRPGIGTKWDTCARALAGHTRMRTRVAGVLALALPGLASASAAAAASAAADIGGAPDDGPPRCQRRGERRAWAVALDQMCAPTATGQANRPLDRPRMRPGWFQIDPGWAMDVFYFV